MTFKKNSASEKTSEKKGSQSPWLVPHCFRPPLLVQHEASNEGERSFTGSAPEHLGAKKSVETLCKMRVNLTVEKLFPPSHCQRREVDKGD